MLISSCDVGGRLSQSTKEFDYMDFSLMSKYDDLWSLEVCESKDNAIEARAYIAERGEDSTPSEAAKLMIQFMRTRLPHYMESFHDTKRRIARLKEVLRAQLAALPANAKVICVTHSRTLNTMSASEFADDG
jgi:hypothetical protein